MADFLTLGLADIQADLRELENLTDEDIYRILEAGAAVVVAAQREELESLSLIGTGQLRDSIAPERKNGKSVLIYPQDDRRDERRGLRKRKRKRRGVKTNAEVGYVLEYGGPGRRAYGWMSKANEKSEGDAAEAMQAEYNKITV